ncbi:MAG TPA: exodeoxyribonuclease VII large subunit [Brevefilum fermentans]|jgi:exodeoxyribonuclease VII large subunit|nr:exodeoxyribonuclease VII large subunit [Brevefilum fermentans]HQA28311.1 exodeoxyribonuclease VII large subunit [Brevefilum fermentans]
MEQYSLFQPQNILSVSQLTGYLRRLIEDDDLMQDLWVEGEISNFSRPSSGHLYFTLKDSQSAIRCVMWRNSAARLTFEPREGLAVEAHGGMGVYETSGQVQLYVDTIRPAGEGLLFQEFLRLKAKLEAEGLFDPSTKQPIPTLPKVIGIVTSPTGAALQDMLNTLRRRFPVVEVVIAPASMQGVAAPGEIVAALELLNRQVKPDVILVGRGGGSIEDLWAFNDQAVARAVAASEAPVISGVGHETDFTLTDFAADLRAPTPTAAAEVATPDRVDLLGAITELSNRHTAYLNSRLSSLRWSLGQAHNTLARLSPRYAINTYRQRLDEISLRLERAARVDLERKTLHLAHLEQSLRSLNPHAVLNRGYAIVTRTSDGALVKRFDQVNPQDDIRIQVSQGTMDARILQTHQENKHDR